MADLISKQKRSEIMKKIRSKDSKIEVAFRKKLWNKGLRYRKNTVKHFGKPDLVLNKYRIVIFIDSCFWHGCKQHFRLPKSNVTYWKQKIDRNRLRDKKVSKFYKSQKWKIIRIWEHSLIFSQEKQIKKVISIL